METDTSATLTLARPDEHDEIAPPASPGAGSVAMAEGDRSRNVLLAALVFLLTTAFSPNVVSTMWSPKVAVALVIGAIGLGALITLGAAARPAVVAGVVFLAIALLSTLLADDALTSFFGLYGWGIGWIFLLVVVGAWSLGRSGALDPAWFAGALLAGLVVNAAFAIAQVSLELTSFPFIPYQGRAYGLQSNPVQLGLFASACVPLAAGIGRRRPALGLALVAVGAFAVELSGSRASLILLVPAVVLTIGWLGWRGAVVCAVAVAIGVGAAMALPTPGGGGDASSRLVSTESSGLTGRTETWKAAAEAVAAKPILGYGPGQFRDATLPRRSLTFARAEGFDRWFVEAHNVVVEYATTVGILGLLALVAWVALAVRGAHGPALSFAGVALAGHLFQPQNPGTTTLMLLALGVAAAPTVSTLRARFSVPLALVALAAGGLLLTGDWYLEQARLDLAVADAKQAERLLPKFPITAGAVAQSYALEGRVKQDVEILREGLRWRIEARNRDPRDPDGWLRLGIEEANTGNLRQAEGTYREAVRLAPYSMRALNGLARVLIEQEDYPGARKVLRQSLAANPDQPQVKAVLAKVEELVGA